MPRLRSVLKNSKFHRNGTWIKNGVYRSAKMSANLVVPSGVCVVAQLGNK